MRLYGTEPVHAARICRQFRKRDRRQFTSGFWYLLVRLTRGVYVYNSLSIFTQEF